jgi:hypothetical protein
VHQQPHGNYCRRHVAFELRAMNVKGAEHDTFKDEQHEYRPVSTDWGFPRFVYHDHAQGLAVDGVITFEVRQRPRTPLMTCRALWVAC